MTQEREMEPMFNPMRAFKEMHHNKVIEGANQFAPCKCDWFCYSKTYAPAYYYAKKNPITMPMVLEENYPPDMPSFEKLELRRLMGPPDEDGYFSYVLGGANDPRP